MSLSPLGRLKLGVLAVAGHLPTRRDLVVSAVLLALPIGLVTAWTEMWIGIAVAGVALAYAVGGAFWGRLMWIVTEIDRVGEETRIAKLREEIRRKHGGCAG
jgi:hypothetical protein